MQNTNPYTFLGPRPLDVAPEATLEGALTAITFCNLGLPLNVSTIGAALRGKPRSLPGKAGLAYRSDLSEVRVVGPGPFPNQANGDFLGEVDCLVLHREPGVLRLVIPQRSSSGRGFHISRPVNGVAVFCWTGARQCSATRL